MLPRDDFKRVSGCVSHFMLMVSAGEQVDRCYISQLITAGPTSVLPIEPLLGEALLYASQPHPVCDPPPPPPHTLPKCHHNTLTQTPDGHIGISRRGIWGGKAHPTLQVTGYTHLREITVKTSCRV